MRKPHKRRPAATPQEMYYEIHQELGMHLPRPYGDGLELLAFYPGQPRMRRKRVEKILKYATED